MGALQRTAGRALRGAAVLTVSVAYFCYVFRIVHGDVLTSGLGGWLDPYFLNYVMEHWYDSLRHFSDPASPPMYFPARGALGYSCTVVLYVPFYVIVRPFLHPFTAYTVSLLLVMETGALCLYALLRIFVRLGFIESLLLTVFFFSSRNVINSWHTNIWSQTVSIFLVPPILLITLTSVRMTARWPGLALAGVSGLLWTLLFSQDIYTGWFVLLLATLLAVGAVLIASKRWMAEGLAVVWRTRRPAILAFAFGASLGTLVFLWIYIGPYREQHGFPEQQLMSALIARKVPSWSDPVAAVRSLEVYAGARSFALVAFLGLLAWVPWFKVPLRVRLFALWCFAISTIVMLSAVKFDQYAGWRNYSLWKQLFRLFPGYSAIRDPKRIIYAYELAVALLAGLFITRLPPRSVLRISIVVLVFALLVAEPNREVFQFDRPTATFDRWVRAPVAVDPSCQSFFITRASAEYESHAGHSPYALDAMFIALNLSIPTLNGYSAWHPPNWSLADPSHPDYPAAVREWIAEHRLRGVCQFDIDARTMTPWS